MSVNKSQLNLSEHNTSTRLLYATGIYIAMLILILPIFNIMHNSPARGAGFIYGLMSPIRNIFTLFTLIVTGFFSTLNRKLITQIILCAVCLSMLTLSISINLLSTSPQLFRFLIFISAVYVGYILDTRIIGSLLIAIFAFIGYLCGMQHGINLPEIVCCANFLYGTVLTSALILAGSTAFGSVFAEYIAEKIRLYSRR